MGAARRKKDFLEDGLRLEDRYLCLSNCSMVNALSSSSSCSRLMGRDACVHCASEDAAKGAVAGVRTLTLAVRSKLPETSMIWPWMRQRSTDVTPATCPNPNSQFPSRPMTHTGPNCGTLSPSARGVANAVAKARRSNTQQV